MPKISKKHTNATDNALITTKHPAILSLCCSFSRGFGSLGTPYFSHGFKTVFRFEILRDCCCGTKPGE
jgi:hypothetical protein